MLLTLRLPGRFAHANKSSCWGSVCDKRYQVSQGITSQLALSNRTVKRKINNYGPYIVLPKVVLLAIQNHPGLSLSGFQIPQDYDKDDSSVGAVELLLWAARAC